MSSKNKIEYFGKDLEAMSEARHYRRWIFEEFKPYLGKEVAEVGAGTGSFSRLILESDINRLTAFEPSDNLFPILDEVLGQDTRATAIKDYFGRNRNIGKYDSVIYVNVLEHIEKDAGELSLVWKSLHDEGYVLILVPALSWLYSEFDRALGHFRRYRMPELKKRVQQAGFSVIRATYLDLPGIIPWYINFRLLKNMMARGQVSLYDRLVIPVVRFFEQIIPPPIGKNILLIAKKNKKQD